MTRKALRLGSCTWFRMSCFAWAPPSCRCWDSSSAYCIHTQLWQPDWQQVVGGSGGRLVREVAELAMLESTPFLSCCSWARDDLLEILSCWLALSLLSPADWVNSVMVLYLPEWWLQISLVTCCWAARSLHGFGMPCFVTHLKDFVRNMVLQNQLASCLRKVSKLSSWADENS